MMSITPDDPYDYLDDEDDEDEEVGFECAAYWDGDDKTGEWVCPLAGTEECDWDCTEWRGDE